MTATAARPDAGRTRYIDVGGRRRRTPKRVASLICACSLVGTVYATAETGPQAGATAPVGRLHGHPGDLAFILKQIKIAEHHAATHDAGDRPVRLARRPGTGPDPGPPHLVRSAHGRRLVQQPVPGPGDVRVPPTSRSRA